MTEQQAEPEITQLEMAVAQDGDGGTWWVALYARAGTDDKFEVASIRTALVMKPEQREQYMELVAGLLRDALQEGVASGDLPDTVEFVPAKGERH